MMPMTINVHESGYRQGTRAVVPESNGQKMKVRLMGWEPGATVVEGSSADYPVPVIARDFAAAFPKGTRMRANHDGFCEAGGDIRRIWAKTTSDPWRENDGMYANAVAAEGEASDFVRQFADAVGTSISSACEVEMTELRDEDGEIVRGEDGEPRMVPRRSERGAQIVSRFLSMEEYPYNAVDIVEAPGADGAIVSLAIESAKALIEHAVLRESASFTAHLAGRREKDDTEAAPPGGAMILHESRGFAIRLADTSEAALPGQEKENTMEKEEATALAEAAATAAVAAYVESQSAPAPEQPSFGAMAEAVVTAGLTEAGRAAVYARIEAGEGIEPAIAAEKAREAAIDAEVERRVAERLATKEAEKGYSLDFGFTENDKTGTLSAGKPLVEQEKINSAFDELMED